MIIAILVADPQTKAGIANTATNPPSGNRNPSAGNHLQMSAAVFIAVLVSCLDWALYQHVFVDPVMWCLDSRGGMGMLGLMRFEWNRLARCSLKFTCGLQVVHRLGLQP